MYEPVLKPLLFTALKLLATGWPIMNKSLFSLISMYYSCHGKHIVAHMADIYLPMWNLSAVFHTSAQTFLARSTFMLSLYLPCTTYLLRSDQHVLWHRLTFWVHGLVFHQDSFIAESNICITHVRDEWFFSLLQIALLRAASVAKDALQTQVSSLSRDFEVIDSQECLICLCQKYASDCALLLVLILWDLDARLHWLLSKGLDIRKADWG